MTSTPSNPTESKEPSNRGPNGLIILVVMGLGMTLGIMFLAWLGTPRIVPAVGQQLSRLELTPIAFADRDLSEADLQGKVTVLHFWGTWCPPCLTEFPEFVKMATDIKDQTDIQVLSVACSQGPEYRLEQLKSEIQAFLKERSIELPTYADPAALTRGQACLLLPDNAMIYPCTFVIDAKGIVQGTWTGYRPGNMEQVRQRAMEVSGQ